MKKQTIIISVGFDSSDGFQAELVMVAHIPADRSGVQLDSIPTHTRVQLPGLGHDTIDGAETLAFYQERAALSDGGPQCVRDRSGLEKLKPTIADDTVSEYVVEAGVRHR